MKHYKWLITGAIILVLPILLVGCMSRAEYEALESSYNTLQEEHTTLQEECTTLRADYAALLLEKISIAEEVENLQDQLGELEDSLSLYENTGIRVYKGIPSHLQIMKSWDSIDYVKLCDNSSAHNPTWEELMDFLEKDETDTHFYFTNLCGWFAESVHNNAEATGIRAALVIVNFEEGIGHALNAFNVVDKGLVFIDCTGEGLESIQPCYPLTYTIGDIGSEDKIAYVKRGYPIGFISLNMPYSLEYSEYERWQNDVEIMRQEFDLASFSLLRDIIKESDTNLGSFFESGEVVKSIEIYW